MEIQKDISFINNQREIANLVQECAPILQRDFLHRSQQQVKTLIKGLGSIQYLQSLELPKSIYAQFIYNLSLNLVTEQLLKGQIIYHFGDSDKNIYILLSGSLMCLVPKRFSSIEQESNEVNVGNQKNVRSLVSQNSFLDLDFFQDSESRNNPDEKRLLSLNPQNKSRYFSLSGVCLFQKFGKNIQAGEVFGEKIMLNQQKRFETVITCSPSIIAKISLKKFKDLQLKAMQGHNFEFATINSIMNKEEQQLINNADLEQENCSFSKGEVVFQEGEQAHFFYLVKEGCVRISKRQKFLDRRNNQKPNLPSNQVQLSKISLNKVIGVATKGMVIGNEHISQNLYYSCTATVSENQTVLLKINREKYFCKNMLSVFNNKYPNDEEEMPQKNLNIADNGQTIQHIVNTCQSEQVTKENQTIEDVIPINNKYQAQDLGNNTTNQTTRRIISNSVDVNNNKFQYVKVKNLCLNYKDSTNQRELLQRQKADQEVLKFYEQLLKLGEKSSNSWKTYKVSNQQMGQLPGTALQNTFSQYKIKRPRIMTNYAETGMPAVQNQLNIQQEQQQHQLQNNKNKQQGHQVSKSIDPGDQTKRKNTLPIKIGLFTQIKSQNNLMKEQLQLGQGQLAEQRSVKRVNTNESQMKYNYYVDFNEYQQQQKFTNQLKGSQNNQLYYSSSNQTVEQSTEERQQTDRVYLKKKQMSAQFITNNNNTITTGDGQKVNVVNINPKVNGQIFIVDDLKQGNGGELTNRQYSQRNQKSISNPNTNNENQKKIKLQEDNYSLQNNNLLHAIEEKNDEYRQSNYISNQEALQFMNIMSYSSLINGQNKPTFHKHSYNKL